ncbi:MAG: hypothetical protein H0V07_02280 [Propionibacteriales bacterium]|nr:hypothetical protein [Propionibacteriales bacterium]
MPTGLPLRHEEDAEGVVASVFLDVRRRMPFVPALFKALAHDPDALLAAWLQARAIYDDPRAPAATGAIRQSARAELAYRPSREVSDTLAPFVAELPSMLLIVTSLRLSLDGEFSLQPPPSPDLPEPAAVPEPEFSDRGEHPLFAEICAVYGTQHLPSIFRSLAAQGVLEEAWGAIGPFLASPEGASMVAGVAGEADNQARGVPEVASFDTQRARPVLDQFERALPRNLIVAVAGLVGR